MIPNDWSEPEYPMRAWVLGPERSSKTGKLYHRCHSVFAVRFEGETPECLTFDGMFLESSQIVLAEYFINGEWDVIK